MIADFSNKSKSCFLASGLYRSEPVTVIAPAIALGVAVLALNFLRDALDPRAAV